MKTISMANTSPNWYYTIKEHDTIVEGAVLSGKCTITGIMRESAEVGDAINIGSVNYIIETIKKRDSKGTFIVPEDAKNAFFTAECQFTRPINM